MKWSENSFVLELRYINYLCNSNITDVKTVQIQKKAYYKMGNMLALSLHK